MAENESDSSGRRRGYPEKRRTYCHRCGRILETYGIAAFCFDCGDYTKVDP